MSDAIMSVDGLGKRYRIGCRRQASGMLREHLANAAQIAASGFGRLLRGGSTSLGVEHFWALKGVSFEVKRGEVVGIIGRNGAGKSTLLKLLSRITEPTTGRAVLRGRVGSLLEVGTGFHPELTGRENIYLSGAILGMRKSEIDAKFSDIVAFSGVERFLDTPIKRYSSGMNVRLGFAVAAHLDPEILLIDEVLAVGDVEFQKRCLGKMEEVARRGRTVLFVSHNMAAVQALCTRAVLVDGGLLAYSGATADVIGRYVQGSAESAMSANLANLKGHTAEGPIRFGSFRVLNAQGVPVNSCQSGQTVLLEIKYSSSEPLLNKACMVSLSIRKPLGDDLFACNTSVAGQALGAFPSEGTLLCRIDRWPLSPGSYIVSLRSFVNGQVSDFIDGAATIHVADGDFFGTGRLPSAHRSPVLINHSWSVQGVQR